MTIIWYIGFAFYNFKCIELISLYLRLGHGEINRDDVIKWKHFPRYWPLGPVNSPHKGQ